LKEEGRPEVAFIPIGATHRLCNPGKIPLEIIEVQVGSYTGEDDIIRLEDVYR
jgi:mannose-1-phosphate guanylyltransferase/mannose-6-phosphate isomerase